MKLLFIVNPIAGKGYTVKAVPIIEDFCRNRGIEYSIQLTRGPGDATNIAKDQSRGYSAVIAAGGDGTVLEVANGLTETDIPLGILPLGSGNDFARAMNITVGFSRLEEALSIITGKAPSLVDLARFNGRVFLNVASVGFDAEIVRGLHQIKRFVKGKAAYLISVFIRLLTYKPKDINLSIDGKCISAKIFLTAVCNGISYGGGLLVNPNGSTTDGMLDVILIKPVPRYMVPFLLFKFAKGKYLDLPFVTTFKCKEVKISSNESLAVNVDGEWPLNTPVSFGLSPLSLKVYRN
jgi:diacylglycerol kinase (ATP)